MGSELPKIEGISAEYLWIFLAVLVGLGAIALLAVNLIKGIRDLRKGKQQTNNDKEQQIIDKLDSIDQKLANDKARLDGHEVRLQHLEDSGKDTKNGFSALCTALIAVLNHSINDGNADEMIKAKDKLTDYLTKR